MALPDRIPQLKRDAATALAPLLAQRSAHHVAALIGTDAQRVMEIRRGTLDRFSLEALIRYLVRLGRRVELRVSEL